MNPKQTLTSIVLLAATIGGGCATQEHMGRRTVPIDSPFWTSSGYRETDVVDSPYSDNILTYLHAEAIAHKLIVCLKKDSTIVMPDGSYVQYCGVSKETNDWGDLEVYSLKYFNSDGSKKRKDYRALSRMDIVRQCTKEIYFDRGKFYRNGNK